MNTKTVNLRQLNEIYRKFSDIEIADIKDEIARFEAAGLRVSLDDVHEMHGYSIGFISGYLQGIDDVRKLAKAEGK